MQGKKSKAGSLANSAKKQKKVSVRFSKAEYSNVKENAAATGNTISNFIRLTSLNEKIKARLTVEDMVIVRQMIGISNDINKIMNAFRNAGKLKEMACFKKYRNQVDAFIAKFNA